MSASLVGSEMCIRDSGLSPRGSTPGRRSVRGLSSEGAELATKRGGYASVSYTHLTLPTICSV
eukprot:7609177-Alexandrium_andersonii.AAC.1